MVAVDIYMTGLIVKKHLHVFSFYTTEQTSLDELGDTYRGRAGKEHGGFSIFMTLTLSWLEVSAQMVQQWCLKDKQLFGYDLFYRRKRWTDLLSPRRRRLEDSVFK